MDERVADVHRFTAGWVAGRLDGWMGRFQLVDAPRVFSDPDEWLRGGEGHWRIAGSSGLARSLSDAHGDYPGLRMLKPA
ncbi:hypothetical protein [Streptomyces heilongjiangensis]|uniref:Uncharacterized protein n=1 Tax=Streptomyces heilongjiangensis TaxID=945052 RepID=A0ABW1B144_9ACTN|nr:hypothetical protein [Streptomyces heilongjiangensis]MDC2945631.1 hypothetical protein [Streptomyces heilongjiangensis]